MPSTNGDDCHEDDEFVVDDETTSVVQGFRDHNFLSDEVNDMKSRFITELKVNSEDVPLQKFMYKDSMTFPPWITKSDLWQSKSDNKNLDILVADIITIPVASRDALQNQNLAMWLMKNWAYAEKIGLQKTLQILNFFYYKVYEPNEYVFREGDFGDTFYVVVKGALSIIKNGVGIVNKLTQGRSFGEIAITSNNSERTASVRADDKVTLMIMTKATYNDFVYLLQYAERIENVRLLKETDFYSLHLSHTRKSELMQKFGRKIVGKGEKVFEDGDEISSVYFILEGEVRLEKRVNITTVNKWPVSSDGKKRGGFKINYKKPFLIKTLSKGDCFGAPDLISVVISDYDVVASTKTTLIFCYVNERKKLLPDAHIFTSESCGEMHKSDTPGVYKGAIEKELLNSIGNIIGGPSSFAKCGQEKKRTNLPKKTKISTLSVHPDKLAFEEKVKVQVIDSRDFYKKKIYDKIRPNTVTLLCRPQRLEDFVTPEVTPSDDSVGNNDNFNTSNRNDNDKNNYNNMTQTGDLTLSPLKVMPHKNVANPNRPVTAAGGSLKFSNPYMPLPEGRGTLKNNQTLYQSESTIKLSPVKRGLSRSVSIDFSKSPDVTPLLGFVTETVKYSNKGRRSPQKGIINLDTYSNNILEAHSRKNNHFI